MKEQMELFEDGGLAQEGGTVDPVSGNDVPVGSTQEEVRDDVPAQLSEGEFVLPADVVRYYGLEKIMQMRDEAKAGLARMDAMGQMGNSDEATLDDDVPFSIEDLDMEDDGVLEYNQGGVVPVQGFTGIQQTVPSAFNQYTPQYTQYQAPQLAPAYAPPQQQAVPTASSTEQAAPFQEFIQPTAGMAPENREYVNKQTGERRTFTFISGNPTVAIPEGFVPAADYVKPEATTTAGTTGVETAQVTQQQDDSVSVGGRTPAEVRSGVAESKDRYSITGSRGMDLVNLIPGARVIKAIAGIESDGVRIGQKDPLSGPPTLDVAKERAKYENVLNTKITGYVGNQVGDLDVVTGGVFDARGRAVDEDGVITTGENGQRSYASFEDWKNDIKAGQDSGWHGGPISKATYETLSDKGKANYDNYSDITGSVQHKAPTTPEPKEETPTKTQTKSTPAYGGTGSSEASGGSSGGTSLDDIFGGQDDNYADELYKGGSVTKQMKKSGLTSKK